MSDVRLGRRQIPAPPRPPGARRWRGCRHSGPTPSTRLQEQRVGLPPQPPRGARPLGRPLAQRGEHTGGVGAREHLEVTEALLVKRLSARGGRAGQRRSPRPPPLPRPRRRRRRRRSWRRRSWRTRTRI